MSDRINMVKGYRVAAGISQEEMAEALGMSDTTYRKLENNPNNFTLDQMNKFTEKIKQVHPEVKANDIFLA